MSDKATMSEAAKLKDALFGGKFSGLSEYQRRSLGAFFGNLVGDALGAQFEFLQYTPTRSRYSKHPQLMHLPVGPGEVKSACKKGVSIPDAQVNPSIMENGVLAGMYTDDSAQLLALAEVLAFYGRVVPAQFHHLIDFWYAHGFCISHDSDKLDQLVRTVTRGKDLGCTDIGNTSYRTLQWFRSQKKPLSSLDYDLTEAGDSCSNGNGALMRNAVCVLIDDLNDALRASWTQAKTTHRGTDSALCCCVHTYLGWCYLHQ